MAFMQTMFEAHVKSQKKAGKSKKHKRRVNDFSKSSDSEEETGYGNTGFSFSVDKRLKIDKPLGTVYPSTEPHPIKVATTAPSKTTRADEITIENAKTGKVNTVVTVRSIFI